LNYHGVTRGAGEVQFVGNGYKIKTIEANFNCSNYSQSTFATATVPVKFMCMIVKTKVYKTVTSLTIGELFDENVGLVNTDASFFKDNDKCQVLKKRIITINPDPSSTRAAIRSKTCKLYAKVDSLFKYRDFDANYEGQTYNYYAVIIPFDYPSSGAITNYRGDIYTRVMFADS